MASGADDYYAYGFRKDEVILPGAVPTDKSLKYVRLSSVEREKRSVARNLGFGLYGITPSRADCMSSSTLKVGAEFRFLRAQPATGDFSEVMQFTREFCIKWLMPFERLDEEAIFNDYLEETHYSAKQKEQFKLVRSKLIGTVEKCLYDAFGKSEIQRAGDKYKHVRIINSPIKEWKVFASAAIHLIEKQVCKLKWFAKYVPVVNRPQFIYDLFVGLKGPYYVTDYTSFESSFNEEVLRAIECVLYRYMLPGNIDLAEAICGWITGRKTIRFKDFTLKVSAKRMSGDPNTSLGNGFSNLILMMYNAAKQGAELTGVVEGDDGLFAFNKPVDFTTITNLGFQLKLEPHETIYTTSFCGLMLSRSLAAFADPRVNLASFGWSHSGMRNGPLKTRRGLLRSKALSLLYNCPRCPILTTLALRFIYLTREFKEITPTSYWDWLVLQERLDYSESLRKQLELGITMDDRIDFDRLYNISPELQLAIECQLSQAQYGLAHSDLIDGLYDENWWVYRDFDNRFCIHTTEKAP